MVTKKKIEKELRGIVGEDNEYAYKEILGLSDDEITDLLIEGVITTETDMPEIVSGKLQAHRQEEN